MQHFPSWRYHADGRSIVVTSPVDEVALGDGWADSPAAFDAVPHPPPSDPPPSTDTPDPPQAPEGSGVGADADAAFEAIVGPKRGRPRKSAE